LPEGIDFSSLFFLPPSTLHCPTAAHLTLLSSYPHFASPGLTSPKFTSPKFTSPGLTSSKLNSSNLTSPHLTSPHLTSPHLTSPHLTSPHLRLCKPCVTARPRWLTVMWLSCLCSMHAKTTHIFLTATFRPKIFPYALLFVFAAMYTSCLWESSQESANNH